MNNTVIFLDSGDTLIDESTEVRDEKGVVQRAQFIPGARELLKTLQREGYRVALVADGLAESFRNMYGFLQMDSCFEQCIYSSDVGEDKPSPKMFQTAMDAMDLCAGDKDRIIMVGNNVERDIAGANRFGLTSVLLDWSPRYRMQPQNQLEQADYIIHTPLELLVLLARLEEERKEAAK